MKRAACALALLTACFLVAPAAHAQNVGATNPSPAADVNSHFSGVSPTTSPSRPVGKVLGLIALALVLLAFSEGFGILGGRIRNLASRPPTDSRRET